MSFQITSHVATDMLVMEVEGVIQDADDETRLADATYAEIEKHEPSRVLVDYTKTEFRSSLLDQAKQVTHMSTNLPADLRWLRLAIVVRPEDLPVNEFWQHYANNRGYQWRTYTDRSQAEAFLTDEE